MAECNHTTGSLTGFAGQRRKNLYALDTRQQICTEATLVQACVPARLNDARQQVNRIMLANHQNLRFRQFFPEKTSCLQLVHARHTEIEQDHVGQEFSCFLKCFCTISGLPADYQARLRRQESRDSKANRFVIVCYENAHLRLARNCAEPIR